jgi:hypothetical protein
MPYLQPLMLTAGVRKAQDWRGIAMEYDASRPPLPTPAVAQPTSIAKPLTPCYLDVPILDRPTSQA